MYIFVTFLIYVKNVRVVAIIHSDEIDTIESLAIKHTDEADKT